MKIIDAPGASRQSRPTSSQTGDLESFFDQPIHVKGSPNYLSSGDAKDVHREIVSARSASSQSLED